MSIFLSVLSRVIRVPVKNTSGREKAPFSTDQDLNKYEGEPVADKKYLDGEVIGVATFVIRGTKNLNYAVLKKRDPDGSLKLFDLTNP